MCVSKGDRDEIIDRPSCLLFLTVDRQSSFRPCILFCRNGREKDDTFFPSSSSVSSCCLFVKGCQRVEEVEEVEEEGEGEQEREREREKETHNIPEMK